MRNKTFHCWYDDQLVVDFVKLNKLFKTWWVRLPAEINCGWNYQLKGSVYPHRKPLNPIKLSQIFALVCRKLNQRLLHTDTCKYCLHQEIVFAIIPKFLLNWPAFMHNAWINFLGNYPATSQYHGRIDLQCDDKHKQRNPIIALVVSWKLEFFKRIWCPEVLLLTARN